MTAPAARVVLTFAGGEIPVDVVADRNGITVRPAGGGDGGLTVAVEPMGDGVYAVTIGDRRLIARHAVAGGVHHLFVNGETYTFDREQTGISSHRRRPGAVPHHQDLGAPMPGLVTHVFVAEGALVDAGQPLFVIEAMKMEHIVRALAAGRVARIRTSEGSRVDAGAIVVEVEEG